MMGRPPKPTALKRLQGNPGKRALNKAEPQYPAEGLTCPRWLDLEAKREWRRVVRLLKLQRIATAADRAVLAAYCQAWARWKQAEEVLAEKGITMQVATKEDVVTKVRPEVAISAQYYRQMVEAAGRFGLDPSSRSKISVPPEEEHDPFAEFLNSRTDRDADG